MDACGPLPVVGKAETGSERVGEVVNEVGRGWSAERARGEEQRAVLVGEHGGACVGELEAVVVLPGEESRRTLTAQPLEDPSLVQARALRELASGERPRAPQCSVETETIAEVDQDRHHLALLVAPHLEGEEADLVWARPSSLVVHAGRSPILSLIHISEPTRLGMISYA